MWREIQATWHQNAQSRETWRDWRPSLVVCLLLLPTCTLLDCFACEANTLTHHRESRTPEGRGATLFLWRKKVKWKPSEHYSEVYKVSCYCIRYSTVNNPPKYRIFTKTHQGRIIMRFKIQEICTLEEDEEEDKKEEVWRVRYEKMRGWWKTGYEKKEKEEK